MRRAEKKKSEQGDGDAGSEGRERREGGREGGGEDAISFHQILIFVMFAQKRYEYPVYSGILQNILS